MAKRRPASPSSRIVVAGDICLDVIAVPEPPPPPSPQTDNWKLTGETRTHFLPGGALLLEKWIAAATKSWMSNAWAVSGCIPCLPDELRGTSGEESEQRELTIDQFLAVAERLTREEVVHSLLGVKQFPESPGNDESKRLRVDTSYGFAGPKQSDDPQLSVKPPTGSKTARVIVLDDTGNRFRRSEAHWPEAISGDEPAGEDAIVVYKLHRPLPPDDLAAAEVGAGQSDKEPETDNGDEGDDRQPDKLWRQVTSKYPDNRVVIVSIDDLRRLDAPISRGLSWERTALDVVWHLLNHDAFRELRECPHLIIRLGLNGAIYWHAKPAGEIGQERQNGSASKGQAPPRYVARLIYDPKAIEGTGESQCEGIMVGYGSVFTAAIVGRIAKKVEETNNSPAELLCGEQDAEDSPESSREEGEEPKFEPPACLIDGIKMGLTASRELLHLGYSGDPKDSNARDTGDGSADSPAYPEQSLFAAEATGPFVDAAIPIIPQALVPDRGYWRLIDTIFHEKRGLLYRAVAQIATGAEPRDDEEQEGLASELLERVPIAVFAKALRTYDRREIEHYRALYALMLDYIRNPKPPRPLSIAVFGPPGAGKSFGVKKVAKALADLGGPRAIKTLTFNLSQYQSPDQLSDAFHLVRDIVLQGDIPLVFFDEFDTTLAGNRLGWLRYFLAPMQDAEFLDHGTPHPIGQAIFVFAGGTCGTFRQFAEPFLAAAGEIDDEEREAFKAAKGPDFLSRLRGTLDIPGLDLDAPFDPYGPVEAFPCRAAILLRRASILAHQLGEKAPKLRDSAGKLQVTQAVLRTLLHVPGFLHGNRSFEALLDMSRLGEAEQLNPSALPSASQTELHANPTHLKQFIGTHYPFPPADREAIAESIHDAYRRKELGKLPESTPEVQQKLEQKLRDWEYLSHDLRESNREQADHIAVKLRTVGLWFRKRPETAGSRVESHSALLERVEDLARVEHDRWVAEKRRQGWIPAAGVDERARDDGLKLHNCLFPWKQLPEAIKEKDRDTVREIPIHLAAGGYEIIQL